MKKRLLTIMMMLTMVLALAGCGSDEKSKSGEATPAKTEEPEKTEPEAEEKTESKETDDVKPEDNNATEEQEEASASSLRLAGGEDLLIGLETVIDEKNEDGSYFVKSAAQDGMLTVYEQGGIALPDDGTGEGEYALNLATGLSDSGANDDARSKPSNVYSENTTYPVYVVRFTSGSNEDTRQWQVFVTFTDSGVYLYGISTPIDAESNADTLAEQLFPDLRIDTK